MEQLTKFRVLQWDNTFFHSSSDRNQLELERKEDNFLHSSPWKAHWNTFQNIWVESYIPKNLLLFQKITLINSVITILLQNL